MIRSFFTLIGHTTLVILLIVIIINCSILHRSEGWGIRTADHLYLMFILCGGMLETTQYINNYRCRRRTSN